ncbi:UDP-N-acetyl-D-galactosamine dehydrogenase [Ferrigenium kumadai]|uniref:UDP-N-acetyl-D-galactosamine dehydrogenase n=1 Tax=Ferrigenium kumadai TaxID=1682490 RepID=A0AAN1T1A6_9PROT|nr:UDP-N-acetyl-D-galactosamine dehydrogenase [Ferrigenium kumadai]
MSELETIAVVGLGYVGLPLAVEFGKRFNTVGYDLSESKVNSYRKFIDPAGEIATDDLKAATKLRVTTDPAELSAADFIVVAVPTPVDKANQPDFSPLISSSATVGQYMKRGAVVIYESTVYPGATEEICIPVLEKESGLKWKQDFHVGYSPERVNPGDKERTIAMVTKVVSGDNDETLEKVSRLYESVIQAGVHRATSIKVAEAAKVIENTQRDLNIALMNELSIIFGKLGIDTLEVLQAAGTKWNFLPFRPGLVGGHCIGVDPYYLTHKAAMMGYHPQVILAGRRINDDMASHVAKQTIKQMVHAGSSIKGAKVIVLGLTFKENCSDLRNSRVADLVRELEDFECEVAVHDPIADPAKALHEYGISLCSWDDLPDEADAVVLAVKHHEYLHMPLPEILKHIKRNGVVVDIKSAFDPIAIRSAGFRLWRM